MNQHFSTITPVVEITDYSLNNINIIIIIIIIMSFIMFVSRVLD